MFWDFLMDSLVWHFYHFTMSFEFLNFKFSLVIRKIDQYNTTESTVVSLSQFEQDVAKLHKILQIILTLRVGFMGYTTPTHIVQ